MDKKEFKEFLDLKGLELYDKKLKGLINDTFGDCSDLEEKIKAIKDGVDALGEGEE